MLYERCNEQNADAFTSGRGGNEVLLLVLHDTCGPTDFNDPNENSDQASRFGAGAANYLLNNARQVSCHYLVGPEASGSGAMADIHHLVHEFDTAYHCGGDPPDFPSNWTDPDTKHQYGGYSLNQVAIGIERYGQAGDVVGPRQLAAINYLLTEYAGADGQQPHGIFGRHPKLRNGLRIMPHKMVEPGDRWDGTKYVDFARSLISVNS